MKILCMPNLYTRINNINISILNRKHRMTSNDSYMYRKLQKKNYIINKYIILNYYKPIFVLLSVMFHKMK